MKTLLECSNEYQSKAIVLSLSEFGIEPTSEILRVDGSIDSAYAYIYSLIDCGYSVDAAFKNLVKLMDDTTACQKRNVKTKDVIVRHSVSQHSQLPT